MRLDPLIIAIGGAARIADLAQFAARRAQRHHRGIDIPRRRDPGIHQAGRRGEHLDRLLLQQEPRHIEVMDHHVAEQPAGRRDVGRWRRAGVAADDGEQFEVADFAAVEPPLEAGEMRIETPVEPHHERRARRFHDCQAGPHPLGRKVHRLFAEHRPPRPGRPLDVVGMGRRRRADHYRAGREGLVERDHRRATRRRQPRRRLRYRVGDAGEACAGVVGDVAGVDLADPAGADDGDVEHGACLLIR